MSEPFIIDAHAHLGSAGQLVSPPQTVANMLAWMDRLGVAVAICSDHTAVLEGYATGLDRMARAFDESRGRLRCLAVFDPRSGEACLREIRSAVGKPYLRGIKIHPSCHGVPADADAYAPVWKLAAAHDLPILAHTWSVSDYNPTQVLSIPSKFERHVRAFSSVRLILGHAGGRGRDRHDATRMARDYPNIWLDFAGDIYCHRLIESLVESAPANRILFGSDYPWTGASDHLTQVLLARVGDDVKAKILRYNAMDVYQLAQADCLCG